MEFRIELNPLMDSLNCSGTLRDAQIMADEAICYNQKDAKIYDESDWLIALRRWNGVEYDEKNNPCENPICFGSFGYYSDWEEFFC